MAPSTPMAAAIMAALRSALPSDQHERLPALADLLAAAAVEALSPAEVRARLIGDPGLDAALRALAGQALTVGDTTVQFRGNSIIVGDRLAVGDICDRQALAIGRGAMAIKVGVNAAPTNPRERRNRSRMLARVRDFWVKGVLEESLGGAAMLELRAEYRPRVVAGTARRIIDTRAQTGPQYWDVTAIAEKCNQEGCGLLVLGAPGAGKTTMLLALTRTLLDQAEQDATLPFPVIFTLSSWARERLALHTWLVQELERRYDVPHKQGMTWIANDQILPLLDGLDEVSATQRAACVEAINRFREENGLDALVVCSRTAEYEALIRRHHIRLQLNGTLLIKPLTAEQIDTYLASGGPALSALRDDLQQNSELRELAETPLFLSLMAQIYQGQIVEHLRALSTLEERCQLLFAAYVERMLERPGANPCFPPARTRHWLSRLATEMQQHSVTNFYIERLQPEVLATPALRHQYTLLDRLVSGLLIGVPFGLFAGLVCDWSFRLVLDPAKARAVGLVNLLLFMLAFIVIGGLFGGKVEGQVRAPQGLWWLSPGAILGWLIVGLLAGCAGFAGVMGVRLATELSDGLAWGLAFWMTTGLLGLLIGGLTGGPDAHLRRIAVVETFRWSWAQALRFIPLALGFGLVYGLVYILGVGVGFAQYRLLSLGLITGLVFGLIIGVVTWLGGGFAGDELESKVFPNQGIWRSARSAILSALLGGLSMVPIVGLGVGLFFVLSNLLLGEGLRVGLERGLVAGIAYGLIYGLGIGLIVGLVFGGYACLSHLALRFVLWRSGAIPWNYVRFLDHCAERILLRKVGGGYIFIHRLLLEYFAELHAGSDTALAHQPVGIGSTDSSL